MPEAIVQLTAKDFENAMDFANLVFSVHGPIDFPTLLPKLYKPTDAQMGCNYAIKRNGKIRAMIGLYPIELNMGGILLKGGGIGAVAVHPNDRGQGHMKRLMQHHLDAMRERGYHFSWLAGQRQRYRYFGYEMSGRVCSFHISKDNIRHAYQEKSFLQFEQISGADDPRLNSIKIWHDAFPIHVYRPRDIFWDVLQSWHHTTYAAMQDGEHVGYMNVDDSTGVVLEMGAQSGAIFTEMIPAWMQNQHHDFVRFEIPPIPGPLFSELSRVADMISVRSNGNWQILDWPRVIDAALKLKRKHIKLMDGEFCLGINGQETLSLVVDGPEAFCAGTSKTAAFTCDPLTAVRLLFGPHPPALSGIANHAVLNSWCPLPLYMPRQDEV